MRIVLLPQCLVVNQITRDASGKIERAYVENGGWWLEVENDQWHCVDENGVHRGGQFAQPYTECEVPDTVAGDYNAVIQWAKTSMPDRVDPELHNRDHT